MFSKLKAALPGKKRGGASAASQEDKEEKERLAREAKEAANLEKQEQLQMALLPWNFGDYVKMALFLVIKLPFILAVGVIATFVEMQVKSVNVESWHRPTFASGPSCFVTQLSQDLVSVNTSLNALAVQAGIGPLYNESQLVFGNESQWVNFTLTETDRCGLHKDKCAIDQAEVDRGNLVEDNGWFEMGHGGINFGYYFPFASLWMLYKLVWIPLWPVDRIALKLAGNQHPPPQPVFRLVTQPYFQVCTGCTQVLMMILNMLRYVFLPNYLLLPLVTLVPVKHCEPDKVLVHYQMDWIWGQAAYMWLVIDFATVVAAYVFFTFVYGSKLIGTWAYRLYKAYWLMTCLTSLILFFCNLVFTFDMNFLGGLNFAFQMVIDFNMLFAYSIDMLAFMSAANFIMESLSMTYTLGGILLPIILQKIPCCRLCKECIEAKSGKDTHPHAEEGRSLLGGGGRR